MHEDRQSGIDRGCVPDRLRQLRQHLLFEELNVAELGWDPALDDGIILCAAPLAGLMPAWSDPAKERANLKNGAYPWATVSGWKDAL